MIIFGLDPAIRTTGYGVVRALGPSQYEILDCGVIENKKTMPQSECLRRLYGGVNELIDLYAPDCAAMEEPFVGRNSKTAIILGMARGGILAALAVRGVPAYSYMPSVAKRAAVGNGGAAKEQVAYLLAAELKINVNDIPLDSTDALSLAICHAQRAFHSQLKTLGKSI